MLLPVGALDDAPTDSEALLALDRQPHAGEAEVAHGVLDDLPLHGAVMKFHKWVLEESRKLTVHPANPFETARVGAALSPPEQGKRRVKGIAIFSTSHVLIDDVGVRQLGGLASELAKHVAEQAQEQQDTVLADTQQLNIDSLYRLPPLRRRPADDDADGEDGEDAE